MKKLKIFMYSLIALLVVPCAILFVACGKNEEAPKKETCAVILVVDGHQYKTEEVEKGTALTEAKLADLIGMTKTGYTFNGWYRDSALTEKYNYDSAVNSPLVLFSEYNINKYNVTYVLDNGADNIVIREDYGTALPTPSNPVRAGYTFVGWDKDIPTTMPAENVTITASWRHFSVSVDTNIEGAATLADYTITNVMPGVEDIGGKLNVEVESVNMGYTFLGWYIGDSCRSTSKKYAHPIETTNTELVAKFKIDDDLDNFNFVSTPETLTITGVKDKTVKEIAIPKKVTSIAQGALAGIDNLEKLEIPFVGSELKADLAHPFGYFFELGTSADPDSAYYVKLSQRDQYYKEDETKAYTITHYYVPVSLKEITLQSDQERYETYVFENFNVLTNLETIRYKGTIGKWINTYFVGQASNPMNSSATKFYCIDDNGELALLETLVIPESIKEIRAKAFIGFNCLKKVVMHDAVKKVSQDAFKDCSSLESIVVSTSVTNIVADAFAGCNATCVVYYMGNATQWAEIKGSSATKPIDTNINAMTRYYYLEEATSEQIAEGIYWHYVGGEITLWS